MFSDSSSQELETKCDNVKFKPKFNSLKQSKRQTNSFTEMKASQETKIDFAVIEEDEKAHKQQVAKVLFKTAKEQFLASNPAAKRSLGASRKAQSKFISPMLGAQ